MTNIKKPKILKKGYLKKKTKSGELMGAVEIGTLIAVIGCFVGLAGWLYSRDNKISNDAEWKGIINTKLDSIQKSVNNTDFGIEKINTVIDSYGQRITAVESSAAQAHHRIDEIRAEIKEKTA